MLDKTRGGRESFRLRKAELELEFLVRCRDMLDYACIYSKFFKSNDLKLKSNSVVQQKKFYNFLKKKRFKQAP